MLQVVAVDPAAIASLSSLSQLWALPLQVAALDFLIGLGGSAPEAIIGQFGRQASALSLLIQQLLDALPQRVETSDDRARPGLLDVALAGVNPRAVAKRLRNAPVGAVPTAVEATVIYSIHG